MTAQKSRKPAGLGPEGARLWREIVAEMAEDGLVPDARERRWLLDACREADMLAALTEAWVDDGSPMTTKGSMGQLVIHPAIAELRLHRVVLGGLLARVSTADPRDSAGSGSRTTSTSARAAALARHRGA